MAVTLSSFALTSLETAKEHLDIPVSVTTSDDVVKRFINAATFKIESYCDRFFKKRIGIVEYQDGLSQDRILLNQWPAEKPSELWIDAKSEFTDTDKQLDSDDYQLELSGKGEGIGVVLTGGCGRFFPKGTRNIKIVYDAGYDVIPDELEDACLWTVEFLYNMREDRRVGTSVKGKNQENITYLGALPEIVMLTLENYKRFEWATGNRATVTY